MNEWTEAYASRPIGWRMYDGGIQEAVKVAPNRWSVSSSDGTPDRTLSDDDMSDEYGEA